MSAPSLPPPPPVAAPTLPPPTPAPTPRPSDFAPPSLPVAPRPTPPRDPALSTPEPQLGGPAPNDRRRRGRGPVVLLSLVLVCGLAGAWWLFGRSTDQPDAAEPENRSSNPAEVDPVLPNDAAPAEPDTIGRIAVDALADADELAAGIDTDRGETELLAELGLDATGNPIAVPQTSAGHQFTWVFPDGTTATVVVDALTGANTYRDSSGRQAVEVDGQFFARVDDGDWTRLGTEAIDGFERLGLARPITTDDLIGGTVAPHTTSEGDVWTIDDTGFEAASPNDRAAWLDLVGLPGGPPNGPLSITLDVAADGITVSSAVIERPATGDRVTYGLDRLFDEPPVIRAPEI